MSAETEFEIDRSSDNVNWVTIAVVTANTITYTVSPAAGDITNYFRVRARIKTFKQTALPMYSNYSNTASCSCTYNDPEITFHVERKRDDEGGYTEIVSLPANTITYTNTDLILEHDYNYRVRSHNSIGYSSYSNVATFDRYIEKIVNWALSKIGDDPIFCVYGTEERAIATKEIYFILRKQMLRDFEWNFALKRATLTLDGTAPEFELPYRFALPSDCLYVIKIDDPLKKWKIEAGFLLSDANAIKILYVMNDESTLTYDSIFRDCLATKLAAEIALPLTGQKDLVKFLWDLYADKIQEAMETNAMEIGKYAKDNTISKRAFNANRN